MHNEREESAQVAHTPGPWTVNIWTARQYDIIIGRIGTPCIASVPLRYVSIIEQRANAALIAAAPELLAALEALLWQHDHNDGHVSGMALDAARAAVQKVTDHIG